MEHEQCFGMAGEENCGKDYEDCARKYKQKAAENISVYMIVPCRNIPDWHILLAEAM